MNIETTKRIVRLTILALAMVVFVHILTHDDRSDWLALIPGAMIASAAFHFGGAALASRR